MAGRLLQKVAFASGISRSSFLLTNGRGASSAPVATSKGGVMMTLSHLFHKAAVHPSSMVSKIPGCQGNIKTPIAPTNPSKAFLSDRGIHGFAARNFNCSHIDGKTTFLTTRVPSIISNYMKPSKRTFSSHRPEFCIKEWEAKFDAAQAKSAAELAAMDADSNKCWKTQMWLYSFACISCLVGIVCELELNRRRNMKSQSISRGGYCCPSCSKSIAANGTHKNPN